MPVYTGAVGEDSVVSSVILILSATAGPRPCSSVTDQQDSFHHKMLNLAHDKEQSVWRFLAEVQSPALLCVEGRDTGGAPGASGAHSLSRKSSLCRGYFMDSRNQSNWGTWYCSERKKFQPPETTQILVQKFGVSIVPSVCCSCHAFFCLYCLSQMIVTATIKSPGSSLVY